MAETDLIRWPQADISQDLLPGISLNKAYTFVKDKAGKSVIVGVIDSGIDIGHEDLSECVWSNPHEIENNQQDDDNNGFVDDIRGWNFLGSNTGDVYFAQLEITRITKKYVSLFGGKSFDMIEESDLSEFERYKSLKSTFDRLSDQASEEYHNQIRSYEYGSGGEDRRDYIFFLETQNRFHYNFDFEPRDIIGDDPENIIDTDYGNNNVIGSKKNESHGTHVAGIIAACRHNGKGIQGVAENAKIMAIRAVPNGDEYDKDVALSIRYAVDNGAKVLNMSFGKEYSPNREWVFDAMQYAESKDVLLVQAAGNNGQNLDMVDIFPSDLKNGVSEFVDNLITVGAITRNFDENLVAPFSNYGKKRVDIFAPGVEIYSTTPENAYGFSNGTSMASAFVAGVATLIRSFYPKLTASQVKRIIMDSGTEVQKNVIVPGNNNARIQFSELSASGKILNAFNALVMAEQRRKQ